MTGAASATSSKVASNTLPETFAKHDVLARSENRQELGALPGFNEHQRPLGQTALTCCPGHRGLPGDGAAVPTATEPWTGAATAAAAPLLPPQPAGNTPSQVAGTAASTIAAAAPETTAAAAALETAAAAAATTCDLQAPIDAPAAANARIGLVSPAAWLYSGMPPGVHAPGSSS